MTPRGRPERASDWVVRFASAVPAGGAVLDLACGTGRHSRFFLERGRRVTGVDRYSAGVSDLLGRGDFTLIEADLESGGDWPLGARQFAAVVVTNYLFRPILPRIVGAVSEGGVLIYETFAEGNERFGRPSNPDFLLRPGELLRAVEGTLAVIAYEHGEVARPAPALVQRICACRGTGYSAWPRLDGGS
ncbi:MAG: class I SAM-dependent methyltransferase [Defluviicoccus sp.]|nr:class I SAM-dependent methyltransferase [Defluviicoccus sp.]